MFCSRYLIIWKFDYSLTVKAVKKNLTLQYIVDASRNVQNRFQVTRGGEGSKDKVSLILKYWKMFIYFWSLLVIWVKYIWLFSTYFLLKSMRFLSYGMIFFIFLSSLISYFSPSFDSFAHYSFHFFVAKTQFSDHVSFFF